MLIGMNMDEVGMLDLPHHINLFEGIFNFKRINLNLFECILFALLVGYQVDCAKTPLTQYLNRLIFIHFDLGILYTNNFFF